MAVRRREMLLSMLRERLSPRRVLHTLGVEAVASCMALRWGADAEQASQAALLHDMTKEESGQLKLLREYGILPAIWQETVPNVYHALTGAALAESMGFSGEVVSAVRWHATGRAGMTVLEKIIFLADAAEPFRADYTALADIRRLLYSDLDAALMLSLNSTILFLRAHGSPEDHFTEDAIVSLRQGLPTGKDRYA